jgi:aminoglycoside phosphotransferase (APT) family kinase protein
MTISLEKIGEGREAEIFAWGDGEILRLMREPAAAGRLSREAEALRAAHGGGAPVPAVRDLITVAGRPGLVMQRVDGIDMMSAVGRRPWTIVRAARQLGATHASIHRIGAPAELMDTRALLAERIKAAASTLADRVSSFALHLLEGLPDGDQLCHGDFHPGNVLVASRESVVIDWTNASRGDADSDVARTLLMLEMGVVPASAPAVVRRLAGAGRRMFRAGYVRAYRRARRFDAALVGRWKIVHAAARCAEGIEEETPLLIRYVERQAGL